MEQKIDGRCNHAGTSVVLKRWRLQPVPKHVWWLWCPSPAQMRHIPTSPDGVHMCRGEVANGSVCLDGCARKTAGGWSLERSGGVAAVCWGCVGGSEWSLGYVWENGEWIMNIWQIKERKNNRKEKRKKTRGIVDI